MRIARNVSAVWCTNCWYYIAVYNGNSAVRASVNVNMSEIRDPIISGAANVVTLKAGDVIRDITIPNNNASIIMMFRLTLDNRMPFTINITTFSPNCQLNVSIGLQANGIQPIIWSSFNSTNILHVR